MRRLLLSLLLPLLFLAGSGACAQQINRCRAADGSTVFSDRRCEDLGATERLPPPAQRDGSSGLYRYGCPRRLSDLVGQLRAAIESGDVNRLSSLYLWNNVSDRGANQILTRLEAIAGRPLVDIAPVYPDAEPVAPLPAVAMQADPAGATDATVPATAPPARARPWGLRIEQTMAGGATPSRTVLELRRHYNCFWISF